VHIDRPTTLSNVLVFTQIRSTTPFHALAGGPLPPAAPTALARQVEAGATTRCRSLDNAPGPGLRPIPGPTTRSPTKAAHADRIDGARNPRAPHVANVAAVVSLSSELHRSAEKLADSPRVSVYA
jgi:hypothetical protein